MTVWSMAVLNMVRKDRLIQENDMDYTVIPESIKEMLDKESCPLTEKQYLLIAGSLAAVQQMIDAIGLEGTIEVFQPMAHKKAPPK